MGTGARRRLTQLPGSGASDVPIPGSSSSAAAAAAAVPPSANDTVAAYDLSADLLLAGLAQVRLSILAAVLRALAQAGGSYLCSWVHKASHQLLSSASDTHKSSVV